MVWAVEEEVAFAVPVVPTASVVAAVVAAAVAAGVPVGPTVATPVSERVKELNTPELQSSIKV